MGTVFPCQQYTKMRAWLVDTEWSCLKDHPAFADCLSRWVLRLAYEEFVYEDGPQGDDDWDTLPSQRCQQCSVILVYART